MAKKIKNAKAKYNNKQYCKYRSYSQALKEVLVRYNVLQN